MQKNKLFHVKIAIIVWFVLVPIFLFSANRTAPSPPKQTTTEGVYSTSFSTPSQADGNNDLINQILDNKTALLTDLGYLPTNWRASLSATYFALYILNATEQLHQIDTEAVAEYILSKYNETAVAPFMDLQALRWLDQVDFENGYQLYRYESLLMINAYAVFSLKILGKLDLISENLIISFVESCYNPEAGAGAYMGMPYNVSLPANVKTPTLYNTYYAVKLLHLFLEGDFSQYPGLVSSISQFIDALQEKDDSWGSLGGFGPDKERGYGVESNLAWERQHTNAIHNLWAIKTLDLIGMRSVVDLDYLADYIMNVYRHGGFEWSKTLIGDLNFTRKYADYPATALNLALCKKLGLMNEISLDGVLGYLSKGINEYGYFYGTSEYHQYYELVSSFHVLYGLFNAREVFLSTQQTADLVNGLLDHFYNNNTHGFCLLSERYEHVTHLSSLVAGFAASDRISDLDIQQIYDSLCAVYYVFDGQGYFYGLDSIVRGDGSVYPGLRMEPVSVGTDYESSCRLTNIVSSAYGHKYNYLALKTLKKIMKLDDFHANKDLSVIAEYIDRCQIMNDGDLGYGADKVGGFTTYSYRGSDKDDYDRVHFQNAYYALETLNVIIDEIGGNYTHYGIDVEKLVAYINLHQRETYKYMFLLPSYVEDIYEDPVITLQHTYYMVKLLSNLGQNLGNGQKYLALIEELIDYSNIKNIYYCWNLLQTLYTDPTMQDLYYEFNVTRIRDSLSEFYDNERRSFRASLCSNNTDHEILGFIADLMLSSPTFTVSCPTALLGGEAEIMVNASNLLLNQLGHTYSFKLEYPLTMLDLSREEGCFTGTILVPISEQYYPSFLANISLYNNGELLVRKSHRIYTRFNFQPSVRVVESDLRVTIQGTLRYNFGNHDELNTKASLSCEIYDEVSFLRTERLRLIISKTGVKVINDKEIQYQEVTFELNFNFEQDYEYRFVVVLTDEFHPNGMELSEYTTDEYHKEGIDPRIDWMGMVILSIIIAALFGAVMIFVMQKFKKRKYPFLSDAELKKEEKMLAGKRVEKPEKNGEESENTTGNGLIPFPLRQEAHQTQNLQRETPEMNKTKTSSEKKTVGLSKSSQIEVTSNKKAILSFFDNGLGGLEQQQKNFNSETPTGEHPHNSRPDQEEEQENQSRFHHTHHTHLEESTWKKYSKYIYLGIGTVILVWVFLNRETISSLLLTGGPILLLLGLILLCFSPKKGAKVIGFAIAILLCGGLLEIMISHTSPLSLVSINMLHLGGG